jgi:mRNA export factor
MAGLFGSAASTSQANTLGDLSKDVALQSPPDDSVSDLSFSPQSDHLAVASWDKKVRIYAITQNGGSEGKAFFEHDAPVLSCHWSPVSPQITVLFNKLLTTTRTVRRLLEQEQTKWPR